MTLRKIKLILWTASGALTACAVAVAFEASRMAGAASIVQVPRAAAILADQTRSVNLPSLNELQGLCQRDLRQSLYDAPPPPPRPPPPVPPPAPLPFTLAGTVMEPGHCRAMLMQPDGKMLLKKIGDTVDGAQLTGISRDTVTVKYQSREVILRVEKKG